jgi:hypothetical protein
MTANLKAEWPILRGKALAHGVDPLFLAAIRCTENGRPGIEMGIMDPAATDLKSQVSESANTIGHYMPDFGGNPFFRLIQPNGTHRLCYSRYFLSYVQRRYCPVGVSNDPDGLNKNWLENCIDHYERFCAAGVDVLADWPDGLG